MLPKNNKSRILYWNKRKHSCYQSQLTCWTLVLLRIISPNKKHKMVNNLIPILHWAFSDQQEWTSFHINQNMNLLQIAAAIARSPAVSVTVIPLTTFKNTACLQRQDEEIHIRDVLIIIFICIIISFNIHMWQF